ncbi:hypothetical protein SDC9_139173 [bioreactor metagenome]|uniref:Uncharacterized protein n=1 Tax=bioreactor metagenome TaxID=1076179 RepID=A0A645DRZ2_9ZZZZ
MYTDRVQDDIQPLYRESGCADMPVHFRYPARKVLFRSRRKSKAEAKPDLRVHTLLRPKLPVSRSIPVMEYVCDNGETNGIQARL